MALAGTLVDRSKSGQLLEALVTIVASGTYPTGGDSIDFATIVGYTNKQPAWVVITGKAGFIYQYDLVNKKMFVYCNTPGGANAALGEHTNASYVAGVTGDSILARATWI